MVAHDAWWLAARACVRTADDEMYARQAWAETRCPPRSMCGEPLRLAVYRCGQAHKEARPVVSKQWVLRVLVPPLP